MFDKLEDLLHHYEELMNTLSEPDVANDANRFKKLMKEQSDLAPIVAAYKEYKECKQNIEDSLAMLEEESDEEMRELAKEELNDSKSRLEELEERFTLDFTDCEFETLNGYLISKLDRIPDENDSSEIIVQGYSFKIVHVEKNVIQSVLVTKLPEEQKEDEIEQV